jgi:periplasmic protein TonB
MGQSNLGVGVTAAFPPAAPASPAPAPSAEPKAPLSVGGRVKCPRILQQVDPSYPVLARRALVQGDVVISDHRSLIIDAQGNVIEIRHVSGHPLLIEAAMNALKNWKCEPTILDGEAVAISWDATIHFRLS